MELNKIKPLGVNDYEQTEAFKTEINNEQIFDEVYTKYANKFKLQEDIIIEQAQLYMYIMRKLGVKVDKEQVASFLREYTAEYCDDQRAVLAEECVLREWNYI